MYGGRNVDNSSFRTMGGGVDFSEPSPQSGGGGVFPSFVFSLKKTPPPGEIDNTPLGEKHTRSSRRGEAAIASGCEGFAKGPVTRAQGGQGLQVYARQG